MRILVTGGNGFVGSRLVRELEKKGHQVTCFRGDVRNAADCRENVRRQPVVYHLAAVLDEAKEQELFDVNVQGTKNMVDAAIAAGVDQFIYVSSVGAMGRFPGTGTEETPFNPVTLYEKSKAQAEQVVWDAQEALPITILRPALILGANAQGKSIIANVRKGMPLVGSGKNMFQVVDVRDVVSALLFVLGKPECLGERFIVAEEKGKTLEETVMLLRKELGLNERPKKIPVALARVLVRAYVCYACMRGKQPTLHPAHLMRITKNRDYDISKIKSIGWKPRYGTEQIVKDLVKETEK